MSGLFQGVVILVSFLGTVGDRFDVQFLVAPSIRTRGKDTTLAIVPQRQIYHIYTIRNKAYRVYNSNRLCIQMRCPNIIFSTDVIGSNFCPIQTCFRSYVGWTHRVNHPQYEIAMVNRRNQTYNMSYTQTRLLLVISHEHLYSDHARTNMWCISWI